MTYAPIPSTNRGRCKFLTHQGACVFRSCRILPGLNRKRTRNHKFSGISPSHYRMLTWNLTGVSWKILEDNFPFKLAGYRLKKQRRQSTLSQFFQRSSRVWFRPSARSTKSTRTSQTAAWAIAGRKVQASQPSVFCLYIHIYKRVVELETSICSGFVLCFPWF